MISLLKNILYIVYILYGTTLILYSFFNIKYLLTANFEQNTLKKIKKKIKEC